MRVTGWRPHAAPRHGREGPRPALTRRGGQVHAPCKLGAAAAVDVQRPHERPLVGQPCPEAQSLLVRFQRQLYVAPPAVAERAQRAAGSRQRHAVLRPLQLNRYVGERNCRQVHQGGWWERQ